MATSARADAIVASIAAASQRARLYPVHGMQAMLAEIVKSQSCNAASCWRSAENSGAAQALSSRRKATALHTTAAEAMSSAVAPVQPMSQMYTSPHLPLEHWPGLHAAPVAR